ncbi:hypothetical protein [Ornithinimicrobium cryptoxanthini]|uniref:Uncharacterized protein n=1 Tax=Ornithinimicrobium cryptoxanthini TaxID=2934161 RepID=A0ABY4YDQ7_9MICO|nr:hypothetical protein [Ornithinimicrobium cryptoxanthini]USQ74858.1 hypothetical protein NF557_09270 [Ornithinimicrobium cryptoxanthini]
MTEHIPEAEAYIRFRLDELSSRNEHHRFEEIATRIAQKRISSNILIATGPVSSGGDQQRDAETFTTRLPNELPHSAGFAAASSTSPVVVACTVQTGSLKQKVLSDLAGICADDAAEVDHVAFFSVHPISEGVTHDLQRTARESYGVTLDIFCGGDISTFLAEPDLVWVARHYLELPSHLVPAPEDEPAPQWYADLIDGLRHNHGPVALTPAVQGEITHGLRHATWDEHANADLPEWLDFMGAFLADSRDGSDTELVFRACYEMAIARFRGMGVAAGIEDLVRRAVAYACTSSRPNIVDDAVTLCAYWGTMWITGVAQAEAAEINAAMTRLRSHLVNLLEATDSVTHPVRSATLTGTLAFAHLVPDWERIETTDGKPAPAEVASNVGVQLDESAVDTSALPVSYLFDFDAAMSYLEQLVDLLPRARAYSSSELARLFTMYAPAASGHVNYEKVRDGFDIVLAEVQGDSATAERCRDRGMAFVRAGQPLKALAELHNAKAKWFNGDTIYGAALTMRYLGSLYAGLGLVYAAKMYACTAVALAMMSDDTDVKTHVPKALLETAKYAQQAGTWVDAAGLTEVALLARAQMLTDPFDYDRHPDLAAHATYATLELAGIRTFWPELEPLIEAAHKTTDWYEQLVEVIEHGDSRSEITVDEFQTRAADQLAGPLLGDIGARRLIDFQALGIRWTFEFDNNRDTVLTSEGFVAALQVLLADIAPMNPVLISSTVRVDVAVRPDASRENDSIDIDDSGPEIVAHVTVSNSLTDIEARDRTILAMCYQLLHAVHVRPPNELQDLLEPLFKGGLIHKVSIGRPYEETAALLDDDHYIRCAQASRPSSDAYRPTGYEHLSASTVTGPGYDRDESLQAIRERYEVANEALRFTLPRLLSDQAGRATIVRLRNDGWLDWQILVALVNTSMNWRMKRAGIQPGVGDPRRALDLAREPETSASPTMPLSEFADGVVDMHIFTQTVSVAQRWKLRGRSEAPGENAMRDLLTRRYRYAADDIPHRDLLNCLDEDGKLLALLDIPAATARMDTASATPASPPRSRRQPSDTGSAQEHGVANSTLD